MAKLNSLELRQRAQRYEEMMTQPNLSKEDMAKAKRRARRYNRKADLAAREEAAAPEAPAAPATEANETATPSTGDIDGLDEKTTEKKPSKTKTAAHTAR